MATGVSPDPGIVRCRFRPAARLEAESLMKETSKVRKIAFVGDHLPRKCGIATFTSDLLAAVATAHPQSQCFAVSVNDIPGGYEYPEVVRFEIEEQDLSSYLRAADFLNISNVDIVCLQHEFGIFGGPGRRSHPGVSARAENAGRHHAAYRFARAESRSTARHAGDDLAFHAPRGDDGTRTARCCRTSIRRRRPRSI